MACIRVALIGLGNMGKNHLRVLSLLRDVQLAFILDPRPETETLAQHYGVSYAPNLQAVSGLQDAWIIATPTHTHAHYIHEALARGVRSIFVEKPLTDSVASAQAIEQAALEAGATIQVGFIERYNPSIVGLSNILASGVQPLHIDFCRTNKLDRINDVDVVFDLMIHDIDLALKLCGPVQSVHAHGVVHKNIDFAKAFLKHSQGCFSVLEASRITEKKERLIRATCRDLFVECDLLRKEIILHRQSRIHHASDRAYSIASVTEHVEVSPQEPLLHELQSFVRLCQGHTLDYPNLQDSIRCLEIAEAIRSEVMGG